VKDAVVVTGSRNVVTTILEGFGKNELNHLLSVEYKERGQRKIQEWGRSRDWNWHLLGQAIECYIDAIRYDPNHQHPWTNLAYVYHLIGEEEKAKECLGKSHELAGPGRDHPGRNYKQVEKAIDRNTNLTGNTVTRPPMPDWFLEKYKKYLDV
jgi:tetratricopeptide (TPR) repeat protein